jgi:hypothetical protein
MFLGQTVEQWGAIAGVIACVVAIAEFVRRRIVKGSKQQTTIVGDGNQTSQHFGSGAPADQTINISGKDNKSNQQ